MFNKKRDETKDKPVAGEIQKLAARPAPPAAEPVASKGEAVIGRSIQIKGEVSGEEDILVEGTVEGRIILQSHHLTVGPSGRLQAEVSAKVITIEGEVAGNVMATEKVILTKRGSLTGDIKATRLSVEDGAFLKGTVELAPREKEKPVSLARAVGQPSPVPSPEPGRGPSKDEQEKKAGR